MFPAVFRAFIEVFLEELMRCPETADNEKEIARPIEKRWDFQLVLGTLMGNVCASENPAGAHLLYNNYNGYFSSILLGLVYAEYRFLWVDVCTNGASSDAQIFKDCELAILN
jgi:hypothetical protein